MVDGGGERLGQRPEREEMLCLVGPGGLERIRFYRRSDGLWHYVVETLAGKAHSELGYIPGHWYPAHFSGLHDSLDSARREAADGGRGWMVDDGSR